LYIDGIIFSNLSKMNECYYYISSGLRIKNGFFVS
jgi:hypothetical protein